MATDVEGRQRVGGDDDDLCFECGTAIAGAVAATCVHPWCRCGAKFCDDCVRAGALDEHYARADRAEAESVGVRDAEWAAGFARDEIRRIGTHVRCRSVAKALWDGWATAAATAGWF